MAVLAWDGDAEKQSDIFNVFGSPDHGVLLYTMREPNVKTDWMPLVRRSAVFLKVVAFPSPAASPKPDDKTGSPRPARFLTVKKVTTKYRVDPGTVTRWCNDFGEPEHGCKMVSGIWQIPRASVCHFPPTWKRRTKQDRVHEDRLARQKRISAIVEADIKHTLKSA